MGWFGNDSDEAQSYNQVCCVFWGISLPCAY